MQLIGVVCLLAAAAALAAIVLRAASAGLMLPDVRLDWMVDRVALVLVVLATFCISTRSMLFGVDTAAYAAFFEAYCTTPTLDRTDLSYFLSARLLNGVMFGACDGRLLPMSWVFAMILGVMVSRGPFGNKLRYLALLLMSFVGIELTTNALRQGLSVAVLVAAVSWFRHRIVLSATLMAMAVALHASAGLVVVAFGLSLISWQLFVVATVGAIVIVSLALKIVATTGGPIGAFLYEIQKYLAHDPDEIWVRVLSIVSLAMIVAVPRLCAEPNDAGSVRLRDGQYASAGKLAATSLPFVFLPYFGYRYIYGVLPIVLWITLDAVSKSRRLAGRTFGVLLLANLAVLALWGYGSGYIRSVPFFK